MLRCRYKRIIDRNSQLGVTHIVYEPRNTLVSSRFNTTDGWGWEGSLWLSMGEQLREGSWVGTAALHLRTASSLFCSAADLSLVQRRTRGATLSYPRSCR